MTHVRKRGPIRTQTRVQSQSGPCKVGELGAWVKAKFQDVLEDIGLVGHACNPRDAGG